MEIRPRVAVSLSLQSEMRPQYQSKKPSTCIRLEAPIIDGFVLVILFRMLRTRELARAMSFPDEYEFVGKQEDVVKQIGNAWGGELSLALCKAAIAKPVKSTTTK